MLENNLYPSNFIDQKIKQYLHAQFSDKRCKEPSNSTYVWYYKPPTLKICRQKFKKKLSNIVNIIVKVLISKLSSCYLKLKIYLVLKN